MSIFFNCFPLPLLPYSTAITPSQPSSTPLPLFISLLPQTIRRTYSCICSYPLPQCLHLRTRPHQTPATNQLRPLSGALSLGNEQNRPIASVLEHILGGYLRGMLHVERLADQPARKAGLACPHGSAQVQVSAIVRIVIIACVLRLRCDS